MDDGLRMAIKEWVEYQIEKRCELEKKYPPNPPNEVCQNAYIKGLLIENSFEPQVGEINYLFETEHEKILVWTHGENKYSSIVVEVNSAVKDIPFWKNIANIIWMALQYAKSFEGITSYDYDYKWIYYFDSNERLLNQTFENLTMFEEANLTCGSVFKATDISNLSPEIELLLRDDKAYTALMMLCNSFLQHYICLICELSSTPYHDHLSEEPQIWEHASKIPNMEAAIVQACRSVEGILGEPPNSKKQAAVLRHKAKWLELTDIDPDSIFEKAGVSYLDFYYTLFFDLRNPSAHSYGNGRKYQLQDLTSEKWILGSAFAQIKKAGWCEDIFYGKPNGGKSGEILGLDIAISRKYGSATHGSMSRIMTIAEKYTWCAKMELLGYLADRIPYCGCEYIDDYGQLEDYVNPYQELCQIDVEKVMEETDWLLPEELTPSIKGCGYDKEGIQKWLIESTIPTFEKWIKIQKGTVTLFGAHFVSNEIQGVTTMMWISSGLVRKGTISSLIKKLKDRDFAMELINAADFLAYPTSDCYVSPLEVCWFNWKDEHGSDILYGNNVLYKNVAKCTCDIQGKGETEYEIPSKTVRKMMGIVSGDGYHYYNEEGIEIASYIDAGERYGDSQHMLLADESVFVSKVSELGLQPVWIVRVLKEISNKARERFDIYMDRDETYLVWKNSQRWQARRIEWED